MLNNAKEEMSYHGLWKGQFWQTLILFEGIIIIWWRNGEKDVSLCMAFFKNILQRQWWVQMALFRQKGDVGGFLVWKHQTCRDAVGQWPTGRSVEAAGSCA